MYCKSNIEIDSIHRKDQPIYTIVSFVITTFVITNVALAVKTVHSVLLWNNLFTYEWTSFFLFILNSYLRFIAFKIKLTVL